MTVQRKQRRRHRRPLKVECLEHRWVLASVSGTVFNDADQDGLLGAGEGGLAGFTVFVDTDDNGVLDSGEPSDVTNSSGDFLLSDVAPGLWSIRIQEQSHYRSTTDSVQLVDVPASGTADPLSFGQFRFVTIAGDEVTIQGTPEDDQFEWRAGGLNHTVTLNGTTYEYAAATYSKFILQGLDGADTVALYDPVGEGDDLFIGHETHAYLRAADFSYQVRAEGFRWTTAYSQAGLDKAELYDSEDPTAIDYLTATPEHATLWNGDYTFSNRAEGFEQTVAYSSGGSDEADMSGSTGNDRFVGQPDLGKMTFANSNVNTAKNFPTVRADGAGGRDLAVLRDSPGNDSFVGRSNLSKMWGLDNSYVRCVENFAIVQANASDGQDEAEVYDSPGDDIFEGYEDYARLYAADSSFSIRAKGFDRVTAKATSEGNDKALLHDSKDPTAIDYLTAKPEYATLWNADFKFSNRAEGFERTVAFSSGGTDQAYMYDSRGNDRFVGRPHVSQMRRLYYQYVNTAMGFPKVLAHASDGYDIAKLYGSAQDERFGMQSDYGKMTAQDGSYVIKAEAFDEVHAKGGDGSDEAHLYDSLGDDTLICEQTRATLEGPGYRHSVFELDEDDYVYALSSKGGTDTCDVSAGDLDYTFVPNGDWVMLP